MKKQTMNSFLALSLGLLVALSACSPSNPEAPILSGAVEGGEVVAVGNSLTAGFINGGLIIGGQFAGYANLVARQITGEDMTMPLVASPGIGSESGMTPLFVDPTGALIRDPLTVDPTTLLFGWGDPVRLRQSRRAGSRDG